MKWFYFLPLFVVLLSYWYSKTFKKAKHPIYIIYILYGISGVAALFYDSFDLFYFVQFDQFKAYHFLTYGFFIFLVLSPIFQASRYRLKIQNIQFGKGAYYILYMLSFLIFYSFFYQLPYAIKALSLGAYEVRDILNVERKSILPTTYFTTVAVAISSFYMVYSVLFFILLIKSNSIFLKISMFIGGSLYVVSSLCFTARDGVVYFALLMIFLLFIFRENFSKASFKRIRKFTFFSAFSFLLFLITFTYQRFANADLLRTTTRSQKQILIGGTLSYIGQQPYIFCQDLLEGGQNYGPSLRFPLVSKTLGIHHNPKRDTPIHWSFGTFLKDFFDVSGYRSLILLAFSFAFLFYFLFKFLRLLNPLVGLLILAFYFQFMIQGVFYYRTGDWAGNIYFVLFFLLSCFLSIVFKKKKIIQKL